MNRTQKRRWNELELKRASLLCEVAEIAREQAAIAISGEEREAEGIETPKAANLAARRRQEADQNRAKIVAYLEAIPAGQPGRIREIKTALNLSANTVKKYVVSTPGYIIKSGLILRSKVSI